MVIAVIAILAVLLLPALARAKVAAKKVQCINNQKQLAAVWVMYAGDNSDLLVANDILDPGCGFGTPTNRVTLLHRSGHEEAWPLLDKEEVGERLLAHLATLLPCNEP